MADISMCEGTDCPMKDNCYRHTAPANEYRQSWFAEKVINEDRTCDHYWENEKPKHFSKLKEDGK